MAVPGSTEAPIAAEFAQLVLQLTEQIYEAKHRHRDLWDKCGCLPVKGDFVSEIPLIYKPVNDIIAHVGFSSFHAFDIYAAFGRIKVVLHHWSCWWILPIEFISKLFPETWKEAIVSISATGCTDKHGDAFVLCTETLGQISLHEGKKLQTLHK